MSGTWSTDGPDPREPTGPTRGEKAGVLEYLRAYRLTLAMKCEDLDAEQMARRSVPPSALSLLGLVRHFAYVEHTWARVCMEGQADLPRLYSSADDPDHDLNGAVADDAVVAEAWESWRREVAHAEQVHAEAEPDDLVTWQGQELEVRDVWVHLVEEYARHVGHADLLRECIDGRTGE